MPDVISIEIVQHRRLTPTQTLQIATLKNEGWPYGIPAQLKWLEEQTEPDDRHILLMSGPDLIGYIRLTWRFTAPDHLHIEGLSTLIVARNHRGHGHADRIMKTVSDEIMATNRIGALCCADGLVEFNKRNGWSLSDRTFLHSGSSDQFFRDRNVFLFNHPELPQIVRIAGRTF